MSMSQTENFRLSPGMLYRPIYNVLLHDEHEKRRAAQVKCLLDMNGKYLMQRADGIQYWIRHEDVGYLLDGKPCTEERA